ncbi:unnamed protein product [Ostreobium quekettii]|uniref:Tyrosinase copper-binding domain-containing protein n=1 Tax=Ostreobium quekettii TaxID=121088 RepID=A0A8S1IXK5_9CHLO|nr:unnamed protein product [Ostreobium quekettii]|eukprot:evm.model.scf_140.3 EVM.evm.TU.scf_140.3   scf_140:62285-64761(+)
MREEEQERFADALDEMMRNRNGPETSVFFEKAGIHGWPGRNADSPTAPWNRSREYCAHSRESFPIWHRAYLWDFEKALQAAHRAVHPKLGGQIALPYWDWGRVVNGQVYPDILKRRFRNIKPDLLSPRWRTRWPHEHVRKLAGVRRGDGYEELNDRVDNRDGLWSELEPLEVKVEEALGKRNHYQFAHEGFRNRSSIEHPHNAVHNSLHFPMTSPAVASFHPIFWLHHCNVDRQLSEYIGRRGARAVEEDFRRNQAAGNPRTDTDREENLYREALEPFRKDDGSDVHVTDMFNEDLLGYVYAPRPMGSSQRVPRPLQMRELPTTAEFVVDLMSIGTHSYQLYVFVVPLSEADTWEPPENPNDWRDDPNFGDLAAIFGGKGESCGWCRRRPKISVYADITQALAGRGLSRHDVQLRVMCRNTYGTVLRLEDTNIDQPQIVGPVFENKEARLEKGADAAGEVVQLQKFLNKFGWLKGGVDGVFGDATEAAVKAFQRFTGIDGDGVAGPATIAKILQTRHDDVADQADEPDQPTYHRGETVEYWVGVAPANLDQDTLESEIGAAFAAWGEVTGVIFTRVGTKEEAKVKVTWGDRSPDNFFLFDGPGGALAHSTREYIQFDRAEHWLGQGDQPEAGAFHVLPVALHEVGHVLGLTHSSNSDDVMAPYYAGKLELAEGDKQRARELWVA